MEDVLESDVLESDEKSVRDPNANNRYPNWYNHITHTVNGPMNVVELIVSYHREPQHGHAILVLLTLYVLYFLLLLFMGTFVDLWIYPFLAKLYWSQRIMFAVVCGIVLIIFYISGVFLNKLFWPPIRVKAFARLYDPTIK
ncbi:unnamed protein product [Medioppia subpectinata]|uniref:Uncharacterized protein n=1 Tax=Medioppia subpectinata TaxID=1979941 RepID=A0A7R9KNX8_9ACAR|nr:unnamed protein product [Medioppia subpectinata]CAG2107069.1 unnamed protein product [Medioppia subpectinata]